MSQPVEVDLRDIEKRGVELVVLQSAYTIGAASPSRWEAIKQLVSEFLDFLKGLADRGEINTIDGEVISEIIRQGEESGAEEMNIKVTREQALGYNARANIGKSKAKVSVGAVGETEYVINVKYRDPGKRAV